MLFGNLYIYFNWNGRTEISGGDIMIYIDEDDNTCYLEQRSSIGGRGGTAGGVVTFLVYQTIYLFYNQFFSKNVNVFKYTLSFQQLSVACRMSVCTQQRHGPPEP